VLYARGTLPRLPESCVLKWRLVGVVLTPVDVPIPDRGAEVGRVEDEAYPNCESVRGGRYGGIGPGIVSSDAGGATWPAAGSWTGG
jgi:hypothetical protein